MAEDKRRRFTTPPGVRAPCRVKDSRKAGPDAVYLAALRGEGITLDARQVDEVQRALGGTLRMPLRLSEAQLVGLLDRVSRALDPEQREDVAETLDEVDEILSIRRVKTTKEVQRG